MLIVVQKLLLSGSVHPWGNPMYAMSTTDLLCGRSTGDRSLFRENFGVNVSNGVDQYVQSNGDFNYSSCFLGLLLAGHFIEHHFGLSLSSHQTNGYTCGQLEEKDYRAILSWVDRCMNSYSTLHDNSFICQLNLQHFAMSCIAPYSSCSGILNAASLDFINILPSKLPQFLTACPIVALYGR